jgi:catechol 2,3-dioxygenase-like lactoylglutathione lyase family enzyme
MVWKWWSFVAAISFGVQAMKLNHVALTVADRERSAEFYGKYFGLTERVHDDDHLLILAAKDGALLALSEGKAPDTQPRTTHFGFEANSTAEVVRFRKTFMIEGVAEAEWQESGPTRVQVFDPDGYRVEVYGW